jgi:hypothetical protein
MKHKNSRQRYPRNGIDVTAKDQPATEATGTPKPHPPAFPSPAMFAKRRLVSVEPVAAPPPESRRVEIATDAEGMLALAAYGDQPLTLVWAGELASPKGKNPFWAFLLSPEITSRYRHQVRHEVVATSSALADTLAATLGKAGYVVDVSYKPADRCKVVWIDEAESDDLPAVV